MIRYDYYYGCYIFIYKSVEKKTSRKGGGGEEKFYLRRRKQKKMKNEFSFHFSKFLFIFICAHRNERERNEKFGADFFSFLIELFLSLSLL